MFFVYSKPGSVRPNGITTKILKIIENDWKSLKKFNTFFLLWCLPFNIRNYSKVILVNKKHSKIDFLSYCPISFLSNISKRFIRLSYNRAYKFFNNNILSTPSNLVLNENVQQFMLPLAKLKILEERMRKEYWLWYFCSGA